MSVGRAAAHWSVAGAGVTLVTTAVVVGARDGFTFLDVVSAGSGSSGQNDVLVVSLAAVGVVLVFIWMRARAADRIAAGQREHE